ncbi:MAG: lipoyl synthase [Chloroflexi bacterium]|nr:lipoyl synthase [Chloroflexota bacterium]MCL5274027.1 lipoyl synthase [Chloroflexota bacterium]
MEENTSLITASQIAETQTITITNSVPTAQVPLRRPDWLKVRAPSGETYHNLKRLIRSKSLHTICEEANCPNMSDCWTRGTATFLIMGDVCTRSCGFCDVKTGRPSPLDWAEPLRVAQAVKNMNLEHVVITSVNRDERPDGGAPIFALCIRQIHVSQPSCTIEVLIPDFKGSEAALEIVMREQPDILNHNVETVPRLFKRVQPQDHYEWALTTLTNAKRIQADAVTKSGMMLGLGETRDEVLDVMRDLRSADVDILTIGQYMQPSRQHLPVEKYWRPDEFEEFKRLGLDMGFKWVESGPLVRSSYRAENQARALSRRWATLKAQTIDTAQA